MLAILVILTLILVCKAVATLWRGCQLISESDEPIVIITLGITVFAYNFTIIGLLIWMWYAN